MVRVELVEQVDQVSHFILVGLVYVARLRKDSTDGLSNFIGETTALCRRRPVTLRKRVVVIGFDFFVSERVGLFKWRVRVHVDSCDDWLLLARLHGACLHSGHSISSVNVKIVRHNTCFVLEVQW